VQGNVLAFALVFGKNTQLGICRSTLQDDRAALFRLLAAGESFRIHRSQVQNPIKQVTNCDITGPRCKGTLCAVALGAPFVFHSDSPIDNVDIGIVVRMGVQEARQHAVQRCNRNRVVKPPTRGSLSRSSADRSDLACATSRISYRHGRD